MNKIKTGCLILFAIPFVVVGLMMLIWGVGNYLDARSSESWPSVDGVIVSSETIVKRDESGKNEPYYRAVVSYSYSVDGYEYNNDNISFGTASGLNKTSAEQVVRSYPPGRRVKVYYNPDNPNTAVLVKGGAGESLLPMVLGAVAVIVGLLVVVLAFRRKAVPVPVNMPPIKVSPESRPSPEAVTASPATAAATPAKGASGKTLVLITLVSLVAGLVLLILGVRDIMGGMKSRSWPTTDGYVNSATIQKHYPSTSDHTRTPTYTPKVYYEYTVDGKKYTAHRVSFSGATGGKYGDAEEVVNRYPVGSKITVYYDPDNRAESVLEPGFVWTSLIMALAGLVFLGVAAILFRAYVTQRESPVPGTPAIQ